MMLLSSMNLSVSDITSSMQCLGEIRSAPSEKVARGSTSTITIM